MTVAYTQRSPKSNTETDSPPKKSSESETWTYSWKIRLSSVHYASHRKRQRIGSPIVPTSNSLFTFLDSLNGQGEDRPQVLSMFKRANVWEKKKKMLTRFFFFLIQSTYRLAARDECSSVPWPCKKHWLQIPTRWIISCIDWIPFSTTH